MAKRLRDAASPYLKSAADSTIEWYPWGEEAFQEARRQDKPVLLDIGGIWCHWCHVMDHGTYEDPEVVKVLNEDFVAVKVDRDERPDVDARYQRAVGALTGSGGWPLTAFLTSRGRVFFAGTYFPAEDAMGRPGLRRILTEVKRLWNEDRERVDASAAHIHEAISKRLEPKDRPDLSSSMLDAAAKTLVGNHDHKFGGFGAAPKFPHTGALILALEFGLRRRDEQLSQLARRTLSKMAAGGIHDHVAGGFHRYSVDAHWTVPHFEKMAYDNAELLRSYAFAAAAMPDGHFRDVAEGIIRWAMGTCGDPERGGFGASQDADVGPGDDGDHYTWSLKELREALIAEPGDPRPLDDEAMFDFARRRFGVEERGDMHHDPERNVLEIEAGLETLAKDMEVDEGTLREAQQEVLRRLARARAQRPQPFVDPTRYTDWNAMFSSAFLQAGAWLDDPEATRYAVRTLDRIIEEAWHPDRGWLHRPRDEHAAPGAEPAGGMLDDQAWMGLALVDAFTYTGERRFLDWADRTARILIDQYGEETGAFLDTAAWAREKAAADPLMEPLVPHLDQPSPGGNPVAVRFLMRLGRIRESQEIAARAHDALASGAHEAQRAGIYAATWYHALLEHMEVPPSVVVFGRRDDPETTALSAAARSVPRSGLLVQQVEPGEPETAPSFLRDHLGNEDLIKTGVQALVCHGDHCDAMVGDPEELKRRLSGPTSPAAGRDPGPGPA